ncbi:RCC1 and BTB domain-containing protein 1-like [Cloeon dipterum]|uniref:RCC1 and BTB domain-containing protein 1-like n=1 Tax=Cloeon dipterum TaxID=197152 RepID=UPI00322004FE
MAIKMNEQQKIPVKVSGLEGETISKISCGHEHTLALSTDGKVYSWQNKQINSLALFGARMESFLPEIISSAIGRVIDIAAFSDASAALTELNQIYIWGRHGNQMIPAPTITSFSSLDEVFAPNTFRPLRPNGPSPKEQMMTHAPDVDNEQLTDTLIDCLKQGFNDLETADFAFVVDGKKIHVHKAILMLRCVVFKTMFLGDWKECHTNEHTIEGHSFDAVYALLKYFYTDELEVEPEKALECLNLAHFYQLKGLQTKCVRLIKSGVTAENAASIYDKALVFGTKELEDFVFWFCLKNLTAVVKSDSFKKLSEKVTIDFFQRAAEQGGFKN